MCYSSVCTCIQEKVQRLHARKSVMVINGHVTIPLISPSPVLPNASGGGSIIVGFYGIPYGG